MGKKRPLRRQPVPTPLARDVITARDYFAAMALPGVLATRVALVNADLANDLNQESIAAECYELADAMLDERERAS